MSTEIDEVIEPYGLVRIDIFVPSLIPKILNELIAAEKISEEGASSITLDPLGIVLVDGSPTNLQVVLSKGESKSNNPEDVDDSIAAKYELKSIRT